MRPDQMPVDRTPGGNLSMKALLSENMRRLSRVFRYSTFHVTRKESVGEHTFFVSLYAYCIAQDVILRGYHVNLGRVLEVALLHDLEESHTGDIIHPTKVANPELKEALQLAAVRFLTRLQEDVGVAFLQVWIDQDDDSLESSIARLGDAFSCTAFLIEEVRLGNRFMRIQLKEHIEHLDNDFNDIIERHNILETYVRNASAIARSFL